MYRACRVKQCRFLVDGFSYIFDRPEWDFAPGEILDSRRMESRRRGTIMLPMNRTAGHLNSSGSPRRFILLPEVEADAGRHHPRVRRYRLTSVGSGAGHPRSGRRGRDFATARTARDPGPPGRSS